MRTPEEIEAATRGLLRLRERARVDLPTFTSAVMRQEATGAFIKPATHQIIGMSFSRHYRRTVKIWPINHTKTFGIVAEILFDIMENPSIRIGIFSATEAQAKKILAMVKTYIETSAEYQFITEGKVRPARPWTDTKIRVQHDVAQKDDTLVAYGLDSKGVAGSRLDKIYCDDLLNGENTATKEQREKVLSTAMSTIFSRVEPPEENPRSAIHLSNSAWHPDDVLHAMERLGWPTLRMQIDGHIYVNDAAGADYAFNGERWDHDFIKPAPGGDLSLGERVRIDPAKVPTHTDTTPLWPERYGYDGSWEATIRADYPIDIERLRLFWSTCRDDGSSMCKAEWIENCKRAARERGIFAQGQWSGNARGMYGGVDLAVSRNEGSDDVAIFIFEVLPSGHRVIVHVEFGKFDGPTVIRKIATLHARYGAIFRVENNAAQDYLLQFGRESDASFPVRPHTTGRNKAHAQHGVLSVFTDMYNGAWLIPNDRLGRCDPAVQRWIDECLYYRPESHTGDVLMASWFAREQARKFGALPKVQGGRLAQEIAQDRTGDKARPSVPVR